ncbi:MAG: hypothetical protein LBC70_10775 [Chitinispirillales bacterium]|jgi:hypothetical protein|nr:hypothetical protein [Chitinispirillales bacterium]
MGKDKILSTKRLLDINIIFIYDKGRLAGDDPIETTESLAGRMVDDILRL